MNKRLLTIAFLIFGSILLGSAQNIMAGTIFLRIRVEANPQTQQSSGFVATYVTYDIYEYYDPGAFGVLYYTNPTEQIDQDGGIGVNDYLYGIYPGYKADFTTNDYRPNRILCTYGEHGLRRVYTPIPLQWSDPYDIDSITPQQYEGDYDLNISDNFSKDNLSPNEYTVVAYSQACVRTPTVDSVTFETINSAVTNDNPAFLGGGQRVFPDRDNPTDNTTNKQIVRVKAQLAVSGGTPTYDSGVKVYFRNFDVDDPSNDSIIDPGGNAGNDNLGNVNGSTAGELNGCTGTDSGICYGTTDSNGIAAVNLTVTMQPGDNFVIAASTDRNYLSGITINGTGLQDSGGNQITTASVRAKPTQMLFVWRRMHIEVDSMGASNSNFAIGQIATTTRLRANETVTVNLTPTSPDPQLEENRFEGGRLVAGSRSFPVTCNIANGQTCNTATSVTVQNTGGALVTLFAGTTFQLYDDDDFNNDNGANVNGDTGEDINEPDRSLLQNNDVPCSNIIRTGCNVFAPSYIRPVEDVASDVRDNSIFQANVSEDTTVGVNSLFVDFDQRVTEASTVYWTAYLLGGYQHTIDQDEDPETEAPNSTVGVTDSQNGQGSVVFLETNGPKECNGGGIFCDMAETAAHEIGHLANADHNQGGLMDDLDYSFSPTSLRAIRNSTHP